MRHTGFLRVEAPDGDNLKVTRYAENGLDVFGQPVEGKDVTVKISRK